MDTELAADLIERFLKLKDPRDNRRSRQYVCKRDQAATFSGVGSTTIPSL